MYFCCIAFFMAKNLKTSRTFRFTESEIALMEEMKGDKTYAQILIDGLHALKRERDEGLTVDQVTDWIRQNVRSK